MKKHIFPVLFLIVIIVGIGMIPTLVPWIKKPVDRVYTGISGYSSDYIQYVSYIKEGLYGRNAMYFRSFPFPQPDTPIHVLYIVLGKIAARLGIVSAPLTYHLARILFGMLFVFLSYCFFYARFKKSSQAFLAAFLAFFMTPFYWVGNSGGSWKIFPVSFFNFFTDTTARATDRLHYVFGESLFLIMILIVISGKKWKWYTSGCLLLVVSFTMTMVHAGSGIIALVTGVVLFFGNLTGLMMGCRSDGAKRAPPSRLLPYIAVIAGTSLGLAISYWSVKRYVLVPEIWLDSYIYTQAINLRSVLEDVLSLGPVFVFAVAGFFWHFVRKEKKHGLDTIVLAWFVVQMGLFLFGYRLFSADRVRFVQTLYFLPMAYGTALFFLMAERRIKKRCMMLCLALLLFYSVPMAVKNLVDVLYLFTDYKTYSVFIFPTKGQWDAYRYLDTGTPKESIVLADYEAANNILIASHNRVIGNDQGWGEKKGKRMIALKDTFFQGSLPEKEALSYVTENHIGYIYYGYQERSRGNITGYAFLRPVYTNADVTIYTIHSRSDERVPGN